MMENLRIYNGVISAFLFVFLGLFLLEVSLFSQMRLLLLHLQKLYSQNSQKLYSQKIYKQTFIQRNKFTISY